VQAGDGPKSPLVSLAPNPSRWLVFMGHLLIKLGTSWHIPLLVNWKAHHQQANLVICCLRAASCQSIDSTRWYKAEIAIPWLATLCVIHSDFLALEKGRTKQHETTTIWHQLTSNFDLKSSDYHLPAPDKMVQRYARICIYMLIRAPGLELADTDVPIPWRISP
jgi:hypothetical protein